MESPVQPSHVLKQKLSRIDGSDYGAYQSLKGTYSFDLFNLTISQIPKDPYAPPHTGIYRVLIARNDSRVIALRTDTKDQNIACADFLARRFFEGGNRVSPGPRGTGYSGIITINQPGQEILERNSVVISGDSIEIRCFLGLPAEGRKIRSTLAEKMIFEELPAIIRDALRGEEMDRQDLERHISAMEDAEYLRKQLETLDLIAFIADGSLLPRESGISGKPLTDRNAVPFVSPVSLSREIDLPHKGKIRGMAIPLGITLITGGGYHGKSTLLKALERGIYNHIPGDGRELCVTDSRAVKIRAYDGRSVEKTDISPFIGNLPFGKDTKFFCTENASGSTSQAANIIEAVEAGARVLLMDEDTCATNFMIRDSKMQQLVDRDDEPITTFIDRVRQLYNERGISTVLVLGGVGDYFDVSDLVIQMKEYRPFDVTEKALEIARSSPVKRKSEGAETPFHISSRSPLAATIDPCNEYGKFAIYAKETHRLHFGREDLDLTDLEQLVDLSQTKALGFAVNYALRYMDGIKTLGEIARMVENDMDDSGLDVLSDRISGHFARFRALELAFVINRIRKIQFNQR